MGLKTVFPNVRVELAVGSASVHASGIEDLRLSGKSFRQGSIKPLCTVILVWGIEELIERDERKEPRSEP